MEEPSTSRNFMVGDDNRGQNAIDFQIGAAVFLLTVVLVLAFAPTTLDVFEDAGQGDTITSDKIATNLSLDHLAHPNEPYRLDRAATVNFFDEDGHERIDDSLGPTRSLNISITGTVDGESGILCWNDTEGMVDVDGCDASDTHFRGGGNHSAQSSVVTSSRTVTIGGEQARLSVRVW